MRQSGKPQALAQVSLAVEKPRPPERLPCVSVTTCGDRRSPGFDVFEAYRPALAAIAFGFLIFLFASKKAAMNSAAC